MTTHTTLYGKQDGVSPIIVIVAIVLVVGLAFGGWYVMNNQKEDRSSTQSKSPSTGQQSTEKDDTETVSDPTEGGKYLVIQEWGVRLPLAPEVQADTEYGIFKFDRGDESAYFASKKLAAKSTNGCGLETTPQDNGTGTHGGTIALSRSTSQPDEPEELTFKLDNYWYTLGFSNGGECYPGDTGSDRSMFNSSLEPALRKLEVVKN